MANDGADDEILDRSSALITRLWDRLQTEVSWQADEWDYEMLFVDFETIFALEAAGLFSGWALVEADAVDPVRDTWLAGWDAYYVGMGATPEFTAERRAVIEDTFARFRLICEKYKRT